MRSFLLSLFSVGLLGVTIAEPIISPAVLHEKRDHIPSSWSRNRKHHSASVLPLRFGLLQPNIHAMEKYLTDVAHPDSPNYGNHWTAAQIAAKFAPSHETVQMVKNWLLEGGFDSKRIRVTATKGWIEVNATVEEAERLLNAQYHVYRHSTGKEHVACDSYYLPAHVKSHVEIVTPTVHFNVIVPRSPESPRGLEPRNEPAYPVGVPGHGFKGPKTSGPTLFDKSQNCSGAITPACLRELYGLKFEPLAATTNTFAIVEYTPQAYVPSDLDLFAKNFSTDIIGNRPNVVSIDGGILQTKETGFGSNGESNVDIQYAMALLGPKQNVTLYQVGDPINGASFNNFLDAIDGSYCTFEGGDDPHADEIYPDPAPGGYKGKDCGTVKPANVISSSYGYNEADLTPAYGMRQCIEYGKLGLMGVTVLYASGDTGVAGGGGICLTSDGNQTADGTIFDPGFPATCPFVTSVGATQVNPNSTVDQPESAADQVVYSGGGFSNYFATPDYQEHAVQGYLKNHPPPYDKSLYNSTGRAFPDLSANAVNYNVYVQGVLFDVFGTSASTPVVGAILTMVNDARLAKGKKPVGFINPTIYSPSFASAFHDITNGTNQGCGTNGFKATKGWDPVTGLGTPNFPLMVAKWLELP